MNIFLQSVWYLPKKISFWKGEGKRIWSLRKIYTPANKYTIIITLKLFSSIFFINFGLNFLNFKVSSCLAGWGSGTFINSIQSHMWAHGRIMFCCASAQLTVAWLRLRFCRFWFQCWRFEKFLGGEFTLQGKPRLHQGGWELAAGLIGEQSKKGCDKVNNLAL